MKSKISITIETTKDDQEKPGNRYKTDEKSLKSIFGNVITTRQWSATNSGKTFKKFSRSAWKSPHLKVVEINSTFVYQVSLILEIFRTAYESHLKTICGIMHECLWHEI